MGVGEKLAKQELNEFFGTYEERGFDLEDPSLLPILKQEFDCISTLLTSHVDSPARRCGGKRESR